MKLIIDIPEEDYIRLRDEGMFGNVTTFKRAVREGIPLEQEPCNDCISRQAAIDAFKGWETVPVKALELLPSVKPAKKMGQWIYDRTKDWDGECKYECSECGMGSDVDYAYCMRCGCKMQEVKG